MWVYRRLALRIQSFLNLFRVSKIIYILIILIPLGSFSLSSQSRETEKYNNVMPSYPGGNKALAKLFIDSIDAPSVKWQERNETDDHPELTLSLVIDEHGNVVSVTVLKSINAKTDARCINLARKLKFNPATRDGKALIATYKLPLKFDMEF